MNDYNKIIEAISKKLALSKEKVREHLPSLYLKEREVLIKRVFHKISLAECGKLFDNITGERVRQIENLAKKHLTNLCNNA